MEVGRGLSAAEVASLQAWERLATDLDPLLLKAMVSECGASKRLIAGQVKGRLSSKKVKRGLWRRAGAAIRWRSCAG